MATPLRLAGMLLLIALPVLAADDQLHQRDRYALHTGDTLELQYRLTPDLNQTVVVQPDGFISIKIAGDVHVAGLTIAQARDLIISKDAYDLNAPELNLVLKDFVHPSIDIAGEVAKPGQIELRQTMTVLSAIVAAGGFTRDAKTGQVLLFRKIDADGYEVQKLNLRHIARAGDSEHNPELKEGDMIYVSRDRISTVERYVRTANLGMYFDPLPTP